MTLKRLTLTAACLGLAAAPLQGAVAASKDSDRTFNLAIADVWHHPDLQPKIPTDIKFFFEGQPVTVKQLIGPVKTSRKTNKRSNAIASCQWAMTSALISLAEEARLQGGNAVVGIKSNFGDVETASAESFRCGVGTLMVGVALKGDIAVVE